MGHNRRQSDGSVGGYVRATPAHRRLNGTCSLLLYSVHGLVLASDVELPSCRPGTGDPDVTIRLMGVRRVPAEPGGGRLLQSLADENGYYLNCVSELPGERLLLRVPRYVD